MLIKLDFHSEKKFREYYNEMFVLADLRRDIVLPANNSHKIKMTFYTSHFFVERRDITGYVFDFIVKENPSDDDGDAVISITQSDLSDPHNGEAEIIIPQIDMKDLLGTYLYELRVTKSSGNVQTLCEGIFGVIQSLYKT